MRIHACFMGFILVFSACVQKQNLESDLDFLVASERAFSSLSENQGISKAFLTYFSVEAITFRPTPVEARKRYEENLDIPGLLTWRPVFADVSAAGDLGYTTDPYEFRYKSLEEKPSLYGHYTLGSTMNVDGKEYEDSESFRFRAFLWLRDKKTYFMMASLLSREEVWGQPVDLSPTDEVFHRFVKQEVLPNIKLFNGD